MWVAREHRVGQRVGRDDVERAEFERVVFGMPQRRFVDPRRVREVAQVADLEQPLYRPLVTPGPVGGEAEGRQHAAVQVAEHKEGVGSRLVHRRMDVATTKGVRSGRPPPVEFP